MKPKQRQQFSFLTKSSNRRIILKLELSGIVNRVSYGYKLDMMVFIEPFEGKGKFQLKKLEIGDFGDCFKNDVNENDSEQSEISKVL